MTIHVSISEAKERLTELIAQAAAGEQVVFTEDGKPVVVMAAPEQAAPEDRPERWRTIFDAIPPHPADDIDFEIPRMGDDWGFRIPDFEEKS